MSASDFFCWARRLYEPAIVISTTVFAALAMAVSFVFHGLLIRYSKHPAIKTSNIAFWCVVAAALFAELNLVFLCVLALRSHLIVAGSVVIFMAVIVDGWNKTDSVVRQSHACSLRSQSLTVKTCGRVACSQYCWLFPWLTCVGFDMAFGSLFVKTWFAQ